MNSPLRPGVFAGWDSRNLAFALYLLTKGTAKVTKTLSFINVFQREECEARQVAQFYDGDRLLKLLSRSQLPAVDHVPAGDEMM